MKTITILGNISAPTLLEHWMDISWKLELKDYKIKR